MGASHINLTFACTQGFFWSANCMYFAFLVAYLGSIGFSYTLIGVVTTLMAIINVVVQPLGGYITDTFITPKRLMIISILLSIPVTFLLPLASTQPIAVIGIIMLITVLETCLGGIIDSWCIKLRERYNNINYPATRSLGSIGYGLSAFALGFVISSFGYLSMFIGHALFMAIVLLFILQLEDVPCSNRSGESTAAREDKIGFFSAMKMLGKNNQYIVFVISAVFYNVGLRVIITFLPTLIAQKGGNESDLGIALGLAAFFEFPAMLAFIPIARRVKQHKLFVAVMLLGLIRVGGMLFAPNVQVLEILQLLQALSFGLYFPFLIEYVNSIVPRQINATAITIAQAVTSGLGAVVGNFIGGIIMQNMGTTAFLIVNTGCIAVGILIFLPSFFMKRQQSE